MVINYTKGAIFDLEGVVSDTRKIKTQVSVDMLYERYGIDITPEDFEERYAGMKTRQLFNNIFKEYEVDDEIDNFVELRNSELDSQIDNYLPIVPGSTDLIDGFRQDGYKLALVAVGMREWSDKVAKKMNVRSKFDVIIYSDEVEKVKPDSEIYLLAAEKLRLEPEKCIAIDSTKEGLISATEAGMKSIILTENPSDDDLKSADILTDDLRKIKIDSLKLVD
ncbi:MAG: HAD family phosphatase [Patescibacteria group bacterium]